MESLKEDDLIEIVLGNGAPNFRTEGLTIEMLRNIVLGGPKNFEIIRNGLGEQSTDGITNENKGQYLFLLYIEGLNKITVMPKPRSYCMLIITMRGYSYVLQNVKTFTNMY